MTGRLWPVLFLAGCAAATPPPEAAPAATITLTHCPPPMTPPPPVPPVAAVDSIGPRFAALDHARKRERYRGDQCAARADELERALTQ